MPISTPIKLFVLLDRNGNDGRTSIYHFFSVIEPILDTHELSTNISQKMDHCSWETFSNEDKHLSSLCRSLTFYTGTPNTRTVSHTRLKYLQLIRSCSGETAHMYTGWPGPLLSFPKQVLNLHMGAKEVFKRTSAYAQA